MSLRLKINLIVAALSLLFMATLLTLQVRGLRTSIHEEVVAANRVAAQLLNRTVTGYAAQGTVVLRGFLQGLGRVRSSDITLFDREGRELYHSPSSPWKAGREAPAWFDRLIAPEPSLQAIDFPEGRLEVRATASRAVLDAWDDLLVFAAASLALLLLLNLFVMWLVGRTMRPFGRIVRALNELENGRFDVSLPQLAGTEAAAIGAAFNRMVAKLQDHLEAERRAVRAERELSDSRELARWVDHSIEQERRTIARELHDELGQSVTAIRSMALSIAQRVAALDRPSEQAAQLIAEESSRLYDAMHGLIPRLAPLVLDTLGLEDALRDLVERTQRSHPAVKVALQVELGAAVLSGDEALALYRAAQEGITNALRHGQPTAISVDLRATADGVTLDLVDDGCGLPVAMTGGADAVHGEGGHFGLRWLAERVDNLSGHLRISPANPHGVHLHVGLPARRPELAANELKAKR